MKKHSIWPSHSTNMWDYIETLPHMPSKKERDRLVHESEIDEKKLKRVRIWDYFFQIKKDQIGKIQQAEIESHQTYLKKMHNETSAKLNAMEFDHNSSIGIQKTDLKKIYWNLRLFIGIEVLSLFLITFFQSIALQYANGPFQLTFVVRIIQVLLGIPLLGSAYKIFRLWKERNKCLSNIQLLITEYAKKCERIKQECNRITKLYQDRIQGLKKQIALLRRQVPEICTDNEIRKWLAEDIKRLSEEAVRKAGTRGKLVRTKLSNEDEPIVIKTPAELQKPIPNALLTPDRQQHLTARRIALFNDQSTMEIFFGVYCIDFIMITNEALSTYRCFYDFILGGDPYVEHISEYYYDGVVQISEATDSRKIELDRRQPVTIEDSPNLILALSSGDVRKIAFVNDTYVDVMLKYFQKTHLSRLVTGNWVEKGAHEADIVLKVIRAKLHDHKDRPELPKGNKPFMG